VVTPGRPSASRDARAYPAIGNPFDFPLVSRLLVG